MEMPLFEMTKIKDMEVRSVSRSEVLRNCIV